MKGDLLSIFPNLSFKGIKNLDHMSSSCQSHILQGQKIVGLCGEPSLEIYKQFNIKNKILYFELSTELLNLEHNVKYKPISVFPKIQRDLTLVIDENISGDDIIDAVQRKSFNYMINSRISDIFYSKKEFGVNKKSMTIGLVFQDNKRTLLDTEVSEEISKIISYLQDKFNAVVRK